MENTRFLKITIIVLLLVNIATLVFMWTGRHPHGAPMPPPSQGPGGPAEFLTKELNLNDVQKKQFEALREKHHNEVDALREKSRFLHDRFFDILGMSGNDSLQSLQLADSLVMIQKQIELTTFNHFKQVRTICTAEQQKKFDEVIHEALRMMAPKPPRGPNGPPHGPEGPPPPHP